MAKRRRRRLLVPESREAMNQWQVKWLNEVRGTDVTEQEELSGEIAGQLGIPYNQQGNGEMKAEDAGKIGGVIGGQTVKKLVEISLLSFTRNDKKG